MKELANIQGQHFFATSVSELSGFSTDGKYAVIATHASVVELIDAGIKFSSTGLNQLIVIGDELNEVLSKLIGVDVFVIGAQNWEQAIELAVQSNEMNQRVICVEYEGMDNLGELIQAHLK